MKSREDLIKYLDEKLLTENSNAKVSIPNELFYELSKIEDIKDGRQLSFCFSYLILNAFLSKYCLYWDYDNDSFVTKKDMKVILGYNRENKTINHLIKVGGALESKGFLTHESDIPFFHNMKREFNNNDWELSFISDMPIQLQDEYKHLRRNGNSSFSAPIPSFIIGIADNVSTLNDRYSTFTVDYKSFRKLLFNENDLGLVDILILYFIRHIGYSGKSIEISYDQMLSKLKVSRGTLKKSLEKIQSNNLIEIVDTGFTYEVVSDDKGNEKGVFKRNIRKYKVIK